MNPLTPIASHRDPGGDRDRRKTARRRVLSVVGAVLLLAAATVAITAGLGSIQDQSQAAETRTALESPEAFSLDPAQVSPAPAPSIPALGPDTLAAPTVDLRVPLVHLGLGDDGNFAIPDSDRASVFTDGAPLTAEEGSTFIAGHVVTPAGRFAPMARLADLRPGDRVVTTDDTGTRRDWVVTAARVVPRNGLDPSMWATSGPRQLVLVTCAGRLDAAVDGPTQFTENLVVTAIPAP